MVFGKSFKSLYSISEYLRAWSSSMLIHFLLQIFKVVCLKNDRGLACSSNRNNCSFQAYKVKQTKKQLDNKSLEFYSRPQTKHCTNTYLCPP